MARTALVLSSRLRVHAIGRHGGLLAIAAKSGAARPLTDLDGSGRDVGHGGPRLLPDGRHFIYSRASRDAAHSALHVGSIDLAPHEQPAQPLLVTDSRPVYAPAEDRRFGHVLAVRDGILLAYPFDAERLTIASGPYYGTSPINVVVNWTALLGAKNLLR
jgi:hypothetical protein